MIRTPHQRAGPSVDRLLTLAGVDRADRVGSERAKIWPVMVPRRVTHRGVMRGVMIQYIILNPAWSDKCELKLWRNWLRRALGVKVKFLELSSNVTIV